MNGRIQRDSKRAAGLFYARVKSLEEVQASLEPGEALVLYAFCRQRLLALVLGAEGESLIDVAARADVEDACAVLRIESPDGDPTAAIERLRALLLAPLHLGADVHPSAPTAGLGWTRPRGGLVVRGKPGLGRRIAGDRRTEPGGDGPRAAAGRVAGPPKLH